MSIILTKFQTAGFQNLFLSYSKTNTDFGDVIQQPFIMFMSSTKIC